MEQTEWIDLVERSRRGDPEARDALVRAAQNRIYYHCKKIDVYKRQSWTRPS